MTVRRTIPVLLLPLLALILILPAACRKSQGPQAPSPEEPMVVTVHPVQMEIIEWDEYTGRLAAADSVEIRARVSGYLESIAFKDGQAVEKGTLLFTIDPRPFEAELARAEASLRQAEAQTVLARKNFGRSQQLRQGGVISQEQFDTAANALRDAESAQQAAQAAVTTAKLNVGYSRIESPLRGRVSRKAVSEGNLVTGGVANATLLTTVVSYDPIDCFFDVDERSFLKYQKVSGTRESAVDILENKEHTAVEMALADEMGFPHKGRLNFIDNRVNTDSDTIELRATFSNPQAIFTPGLFARIRIPASQRYKATLIPDQAIQTDQSQTFVYLVGADGKAVYRKVTLGPIVDNLRVVRSGVMPGDRVIFSGTQSVRPGAPVRVEERPVGEIAPGVKTPGPSATPPKIGREQPRPNEQSKRTKPDVEETKKEEKPRAATPKPNNRRTQIPEEKRKRNRKEEPDEGK